MNWLMIYILIFCFFTAFVAGIAGFLVSHWWFKPKNNPNKCFVFVPLIDRPYKGKLHSTSAEGSIYLYNKNRKTVIVPKSYPIIFHWYKRMIYLNNINQLIPEPQGKSISNQAKNDLIRELVTSHIGSDAIRAIKGKQNAFMIIIIAVIVTALIAGTMGYMMHKPATIINKPAITQPVNPSSNISITQGGKVE